jgi:signal transduction histidine kinase
MLERFGPRVAYGRTERTIALTRLTLAVVSLLSAWFDPDEAARRAGPVAALYIGYVAYSVLLAGVIWNRARPRGLPLATLIIDMLVLSGFQFLISGPPNPMFMYFVFIVFCAALRWGWSGALRIIPVCAGLLLLVGTSTSRGLDLEEFELNHLVIRMGYLAMIGALLVFLGWYEANRRQEIQQLARWPGPEGLDDAGFVQKIIEYGARLAGADAAVVVWELTDEPRVTIGHWTAQRFEVTTHAAVDVEPLVAEPLAPHAFIGTALADPATRVVVQRGSRIDIWRGAAVRGPIADRLGSAPTGSAAFVTDRLSGRAFFTWSEPATAEVLPLIEAIARQLGVSLDQMHARERQRRLDIGEERVRLARDLHDGLLQSLTSVRFELQRLGRKLAGSVPAETRQRLLAMERALAGEQRELRLFIEDLKPFTSVAASGSLARRLEEACAQLSDQWQVPIDVRIDTPAIALPTDVGHAVEAMMQEAVVNALKHGDPSRVRVRLAEGSGGVELTVVDDGRGFDFEGAFEHDELATRGLGPVSLRERVQSLGGHLAIKSGPTGARVALVLPYMAERTP